MCANLTRMSWWHLKNHYSLKSAAYEYKWTQSHNLQKADTIIRPLFFLQSHTMRCTGTRIIIHQEDCGLFSKNTVLPKCGSLPPDDFKAKGHRNGGRNTRLAAQNGWLAGRAGWDASRVLSLSYVVFGGRVLWPWPPSEAFPSGPGAPCLRSAPSLFHWTPHS